jgi:DNA-binding transcriptional LysR family regulator
VSGRPQSIYETQHVTTMLGLVEAGLGVAAVPSLAMPGADHPVLVSVALSDPVVTRRVGLIRRKGRTLSPSAQQLYDFLLEMTPARKKAVRPRASQ